MPNILCLTETWFSPETISSIPGYKGCHVTRDGRSGGVSAYVKECISSRQLDDFSYANLKIEVCTIEICVNQSVFIIIVIYRPHSDSIVNFNSHLSNFLENPFFTGKTCILLGDLNICLLKEDPAVLEYSNLLFTHHFSNIITKPTHFSAIDNIAPSLLDHIFLNKFISYSCGIIDLDFTDHLPTYIHLNIDSCSPNNKIKIHFRLINDETKENFKSLVQNFDWQSIVTENSETYAEFFLSQLDKLYQRAFPLKTKLVSSKRVTNPWVTPQLSKLLKSKSDYFYLYKKNLVSKLDNNRYKNRLNKLIKKVKSKYYHNLFDRNRNNMKKTWKTINSLLSKNVNKNTIKKILYNNIEFTTEKEIADIFNNYFCSIGNDLDSLIPVTTLDPLHYMDFNFDRSFWLNPVSNSAVEFHIKCLKNSKQNINSINIQILKESASFLSVIIANVINSCFIAGNFPRVLKEALVLPLFKKGDATLVSNYRPISILPWLSKLYEKCLKSRLLSYICSNNIIHPVQYGFQPGKSTQDAILHIIEKIYSNFNERLVTIGIFIDFSKCFDTINRKILILKLKRYGIRGLPLQILISYLENLYQSV